jgi:hypothetical protein
MSTTYQTPPKTLALRNLLAKVPAVASRLVSAEIRATGLPGYERGVKQEYPGKDYAFPASLEKTLADIQKEVDAFLDAKYMEAQSLTLENVVNANRQMTEKLGSEPDLIPLPVFRKREPWDVFSQAKSAIHDGARNRWYEANGMDAGNIPADANGVELDF